MTKRDWLITGLILVLAAFLRLWHLGAVPLSLYWDEAAILVDAKSVAQSGLDMHGRPWFQLMYPSYGDYKLPVYIWLASASVKLFGVHNWALRLPSVIAGLATIVLAGLIAKAFIQPDSTEKDANQSLSASLLTKMTMLVVSISPWAILFSRTGFEGHVAQAWLAASVWFLLKARQRWYWGIGAAICGVISTYSYFSVRFVWPGVLVAVSLWLIFHLYRNTLVKKLPLKYQVTFLAKQLGLLILLPLSIFVVGLIPMLRSPLYAESTRFRLGTDSILQNEAQIITSNVYRELAGNSIIDRFIFHRLVLTIKELAINYSDHLSFSYLFLNGDPNLRHGTGFHGLFLLPMVVSFLFGLWWLSQRRLGVLGVLVVWWMFALIPASVPQTTPHALRSLNALVPLAIIIGVGLSVIAQNAWRTWQQKNWTLNSVIVISLVAFYQVWLGLSIGSFAGHYFVVYPKISASEWQYGYEQIVYGIETMRGTEQTPVVVLPIDERLYLWSMAYGHYTAQDFHSWQSQGWQFRSFDSISFSDSNWLAPLREKGEVILVGHPEQINEELNQVPVAIHEQLEINDAVGQPLYRVIKVKPKQ